MSLKQCIEDYTGETGRHLIELVKNHSGKDAMYYLFEHAIQTKHKVVLSEDFKIIGKG